MHTIEFWQIVMQNSCDFGSSLRALDDFESSNQMLQGSLLINFERSLITSSIATHIEGFLLVFLAYIDNNDDSAIIGVSGLELYSNFKSNQDSSLTLNPYNISLM